MFASVRMVKDWQKIAVTDADREALLWKKVSGYPVLAFMRQNPLIKTYQFGLEDAIYYAPNPIWGDHFGPSRYRDFASLAPRELHAKLINLGFDSMLVHTGRWPQVNVQPDFGK